MRTLPIALLLAAAAAASATLGLPDGGAAGGAAGARGDPAIGPFVLASPDSSSTLRLGLATQLRATYENEPREADDGGHCAICGEGDRTQSGWLEVRRLRLSFDGRLLRPELRYRLQLGAAPGAAELLDVCLDYTIEQPLAVRYGQFKIPFTRYRIQSFQRSLFPDWAIVTRIFGAERQLGVAVHNGYERPPARSFVLGLFTGVNARAAHGLGVARLYGAEIENPSALASGTVPRAEVHPELALHLGAHTPGMDVQTDSDGEGGGLRESVGFSAAWDLDAERRRDFSARLAAELLLKVRGASFDAIGYAGYAPILGDRLAVTGGLFQGAWRRGGIEVAARFAIVDPTRRLVEDIEEQVPSLTDVLREEREATLGFNVYQLGHNVKWQHDVSWNRKTYAGARPEEYVARSQLQVAF